MNDADDYEPGEWEREQLADHEREREALHPSYRTDRPWVKPNHHHLCCCWKCLPVITHRRPDLDRLSDVYAYPCGHLVAVSNALQNADFAAGASHRHAYGNDPITCPRCP